MTIDLVDINAETSPYPVLAALRSAGPVVEMPSGFWAATGYDAATEVLRSTDFCSSPIGALYRDRLPGGAARDEMSNRINFLDPPDHPRVRRLVAKAFTPRRVSEMVPWIRRTADERAAALGDEQYVDLVEAFAHEVPSLVISQLLGVPVAERARLTALADAVTPLLSPAPDDDQIAAAVEAAEEMHRVLGALVDQRRSTPADDLLSALVAVEDGGERLARPELLSLAATLYSAGHRTTRDSFVNGLVRLLDGDAALYRRVVAGEWGIDSVARELLRLDTPTLYVARIAAVDTTVGGVAVPSGAPLLVFLAAANRDPAKFDRPDEFDPDREGPPALSFALGAHYCLGASLAAAEVEAMLAAAVAAWPGLRREDRTLVWTQRGPFRGLERLEVSLH